MIEILNMQTMLKLIEQMYSQTTVKSEAADIRFKHMSPIDLGIFKQLIPPSYNEKIHSQLVKINEMQNESKSKSESAKPEKKSPPESQASSRKREDKLVCKETVNKISQYTFQQIANSLSPEP
jgi:hypothetical protein